MICYLETHPDFSAGNPTPNQVLLRHRLPNSSWPFEIVHLSSTDPASHPCQRDLQPSSFWSHFDQMDKQNLAALFRSSWKNHNKGNIKKDYIQISFNSRLNKMIISFIIFSLPSRTIIDSSLIFPNRNSSNWNHRDFIFNLFRMIARRLRNRFAYFLSSTFMLI